MCIAIHFSCGYQEQKTCRSFLGQNFLIKIILKTWWVVFLKTRNFPDITMLFQLFFTTMIQ